MHGQAPSTGKPVARQAPSTQGYRPGIGQTWCVGDISEQATHYPEGVVDEEEGRDARAPVSGLETERGGVQVYSTALRSAVNEDLKKEWEKYLEQTRNHVRIVEGVLAQLSLDPETETPGRLIVRHIGEALVKAMKMALDAGEPAAAEVVAAECVVLAETKDHLNWELIGELGKSTKGEEG